MGAHFKISYVTNKKCNTFLQVYLVLLKILMLIEILFEAKKVTIVKF